MLFLMNGNNKKPKHSKEMVANMDRVKELFLAGKFPVATTDRIEDRTVTKVLGLVACRGFDSDEAFFGMAARAVNKGAQAIIGYKENVAFHPDGSKHFSCYGTAVQLCVEEQKALPEKANVTGKSNVTGSNRVSRRA